jgi:hypothetical protein
LFFLDSLVEQLAAGDSQLTVTLEYYGNIVTDMRLKDIVPPSSGPRK